MSIRPPKSYPGDMRSLTQWLAQTSVTAASIDPASRSWGFDGLFSATDADTVAWATGTFSQSDGSSFTIAGGNTGNMTLLTYIYYDSDVSTTAFQTTTTAATAVGANKILVGVAQNKTDEAFFNQFGGTGGILVSADAIAANTITVNELAATITTTKILTLSGAGKIQAGLKTSADDTDKGLFIGGDGAGGFDIHVGDATSSLHWDDSANKLTIKGQLELNNVQTFTPTWGTGFSTDPTGDISYIDMGTYVILFVVNQSTGTSDTGAMSFTGPPAAIRPSTTVFAPSVCINNGVRIHVDVGITAAGNVLFSASDATGTFVSFSATGFTTSGTKGLSNGWTFLYPIG